MLIDFVLQGEIPFFSLWGWNFEIFLLVLISFYLSNAMILKNHN
jgi:hypothetical protein